MKAFPLPAIAAALAAAIALPFSLAAAGTFLLTAGLGCIIHADYALRQRRAPLPRLPCTRPATSAHPTFRREPHRLAA